MNTPGFLNRPEVQRLIATARGTISLITFVSNVVHLMREADAKKDQDDMKTKTVDTKKVPAKGKHAPRNSSATRNPCRIPTAKEWDAAKELHGISVATLRVFSSHMMAAVWMANPLYKGYKTPDWWPARMPFKAPGNWSEPDIDTFWNWVALQLKKDLDPKTPVLERRINIESFKDRLLQWNDTTGLVDRMHALLLWTSPSDDGGGASGMSRRFSE